MTIIYPNPCCNECLKGTALYFCFYKIWLNGISFHHFIDFYLSRLSIFEHNGYINDVCLFVWFDSLRPVNNLSVIKGRVFLGWTSTKLGLMFLLKDTTQWRRWGSNPRPFGLESSTLPLSHCAPYINDVNCLFWSIVSDEIYGSSVVECLTETKRSWVGASPASMHCVLEQDTLILA